MGFCAVRHMQAGFAPPCMPCFLGSADTPGTLHHQAMAHCCGWKCTHPWSLLWSEVHTSLLTSTSEGTEAAQDH